LKKTFTPFKTFLFCLVAIWFSSYNIHAQNEGWAICNSGANLYFKIVGKGNPVLVVGEAGHSSNYMNQLIGELAKNNRVIYFDARATGKSKLPVIHDSTVNFRKAVADLEGLRAVLRISKWSVLAHGFGSSIAAAYATQYPRNIHRLVLVNPAWGAINNSDFIDPYFDTFEEYDFSPLLSQDTIARRFDVLQKQLRNDISATDSVNRWKAILGFQAATFVYDTLHEPYAAQFLGEKVSNFSVKRRLNLRFAPKAEDCLKSIRNLGIATMVIVSKNRKSLTNLVSFWRDHVPTAQITSIEKAHHFIWLDNPTAFYPPVNIFLGKYPIETPTVYASKKKNSRAIGRRY
jgi:proline iminopeptidase